MINLGTTLLGVINTTSYHSINHQIATYVLENLERFDYLTEPELARACSVSKSSVNRFCKELGYESFARFQADVLRFRRRNHYKYELGPEDVRDPDRTLTENYCASVARSAGLLARNVDDAVLEELARDLDRYEDVVVVGEMQSGDVACSFQHNLFEAGRVVTANVYNKEQRELLERLSPGTLVIVFSLFGHFFPRVLDAEGAPPRPEGVKLCWITSSPEMGPAAPADVVVDCGLGKNLAAGNLAMEMVANAIVMHYWRLHHPGAGAPGAETAEASDGTPRSGAPGTPCAGAPGADAATTAHGA